MYSIVLLADLSFSVTLTTIKMEDSGSKQIRRDIISVGDTLLKTHSHTQK